MHNATSLFFVSFNFSFCKTFVYVIFWNVKSVEFLKSVKWECLTWCNQVLARSGHSKKKKCSQIPKLKSIIIIVIPNEYHGNFLKGKNLVDFYAMQ
jgi:phage FluMu protein Com